jgi:hypothetical protein
MGKGFVLFRLGVIAALAGLNAGCGPVVEEGSESVATTQEALVRACGSGAQCSSWVFPSVYADTNGDKHLIYVPDHEGDRIPDFGQVGRRRGAKGLPSEQPGGHPAWAACQGCFPLAPDSTATSTPSDICSNSSFDGGTRIQAALNIAAQEAAESPSIPSVVVFLPRGLYSVKNRLFITNRVVLAGESQNSGGGQPPTTLYICGTDTAEAIKVSAHVPDQGPGSPANFSQACNPQVCQGILAPTPVKVLAGFENSAVGPRRLPMPAGIHSLNVGPNHGLVAGNVVQIFRKQTAAWTSAIGLTTDWPLGTADVKYERTIVRIEPRDDDPLTYRVFFDQPLTNAFETMYDGEQTLVDGRWYTQHTIHKFDAPPTRARDVGLHKMRIVGVQNNCSESTNACESSQDAIRVEWAEDFWIKDVTVQSFWRYGVHLVGSTYGSSGVTHTDASRYGTVELTRVAHWGNGPTGGSRRYGFNVGGELNLITTAEVVDGRHDFLVGGGPNVFLQCTSTTTLNHIATHKDWSHGGLFEGIVVNSPQAEPEAGFIVARHVKDTSPNSLHGWTGANIVTWNSTAAGYKYFNPPTAQSWLIGSSGTYTPPVTSLGESNAHFDFYQAAEHGTAVSLHEVSAGGASLYRTANYLDRGVSNLEHRTYYLGDADNFSAQLSAGDPTFVNPDFAAWVSGPAPAMNWGAVRGMDYTSSGTKTIPFTIRYALGSSESVLHAYLAFRIMRSSGSVNDAITVASDLDGDFSNDAITYLLTGLSEDLTGPKFPGEAFLPANSPVVRVLDLAPLLEPMNETVDGKGELNVNFKERIRVDWAALTLIVSS